MFSAKVIKSISISLAIFAGSAGLISLIFATEPEAKREAASKRTAMLVEVTEVVRSDYQPHIVAMATVVPAQRLHLRSRVAGKVVSLADSFMPGAYVAANQFLLSVDPADYRNQVLQQESELAQAEAALAIEMGEQKLAQQEYKSLNRELSAAQTALVLREPQLKIAQARVKSARASLAQAELQLQRTEIKAPFNAHVLDRRVSLGAEIGAGDALGELVSTERYWVEATVPINKVRWLANHQDASPVRIYHRGAWANGSFREGRLLSVVGALDDNTRMARVLVEVEDPLALNPLSAGLPAMMLGTFVSCELPTITLEQVVRLPRKFLRKNDTAWVMSEGKLSIRPLEIQFKDADYVYVKSGLESGESLVVSDLSRVREGAELRLTSAASSPVDDSVADSRAIDAL